MRRDQAEPVLDMKEEQEELDLMQVKEEQREPEAPPVKDEEAEPEPVRVKEEQEEREQLVLKWEAEPGPEQNCSITSTAAGSQDQRRRNHDASGSQTRNKRRCGSKDVGAGVAGVAEEEPDLVAQLLEAPFCRRARQEKLEIVGGGRPTPTLADLSQQGKGFVRHFRTSNYERYPWLTASARRCRLYCWECLLFSSDRVGVWSHTGFSNLSCLTKAAIRHQGTAAHLQATVLLRTFGEARGDERGGPPPGGAARREAELRNEQVKKNRDVLKKLTDCVLFLGQQKLYNRGNYAEFLAFLAENDPDLRYHLSTNEAFGGTSGGIEGDLIDAVGEAIGEEIKAEVREAPFVAVIADETADARLALVLRYITDGGARERFVRFDDVPAGRRADDVAALLLGFLEEHGCRAEKVVAQCYDGAAVAASGRNEVQVKVKEKAPMALFVHSSAHRLNTVLTQGAAKLKHAKVFFGVLAGLAAFFSRRPRFARQLDDICRHHNPNAAPARWQQAWRLVETVFQKRWALKELFQGVLGRHYDHDGDALLSAQAFAERLDDFEFCFLLGAFNGVFRHAEALAGTLQRPTLDVDFCLAKVKDFCDTVERERSRFAEIYDDAARVSGGPNAQGDPEARYRRLHGEILDNVLGQTRDRFRDHEKLAFLSLLDPEHFKSYRNKFPQALFSDLTRSHGALFDPTRLKTELTVMYGMADFEGRRPAELLDFLRRKRLREGMGQLYTLVCLVLTVPAAAAAERSSSASRRVEAYARDAGGETRLSALASMSIEKELIGELKRADKLYDRVIDIFSRKESRTDFIFQ